LDGGASYAYATGASTDNLVSLCYTFKIDSGETEHARYAGVSWDNDTSSDLTALVSLRWFADSGNYDVFWYYNEGTVGGSIDVNLGTGVNIYLRIDYDNDATNAIFRWSYATGTRPTGDGDWTLGAEVTTGTANETQPTQIRIWNNGADFDVQIDDIVVKTDGTYAHW